MIFILKIGVKVLRYFGRKRDRMKLKKKDLKMATEVLNAYKGAGMSSIERLMKNYKWTSDDLKGAFDYAKEPVVTIAHEKGDCDDFATLWRELLDKHEYDMVMFSAFSKRIKGHVMLAIESRNGHFYVVSNTKYKRMKVDNMYEAIRQASKDFYHDVFEILLFDDNGLPQKTLSVGK